MPNSNLRIIGALNAVLLFSTPAHAAGDQPALNEVVVTATRVEQSIDQIIGAVHVITREEIERLQPQSLQDLLRNQTGIDLTSQGGLGKLTAMFIRGTENEHVLVLIDGVRTGSVSSGTTPFEYLPPDQIERIEIVRGPRSSLYGADAIGGVIQIFTRKGNAGPGMSASARIGGGSYDTSQAGGSFHGAIDNTTFDISATERSSQGFNACRGSAATFQGCFTDEPDRDGFSSRSGSLRIGYRSGIAKLDASALFAEGRNEFDGGFQNETEFRGLTPSLRATIDATKNWRITLAAGSSRDEQDSFKDGVYRSTFNTERRSASLQSDLTLPHNQLLTAGADFLDDNLDSDTQFTAASRDNGGVFAQYQVGIGSHRLSLSGRYDDNQQFGAHKTGGAGWKWTIAAPIHVMAAWGSAFRAPSFNDLYYPGFSNPNLAPERSKSFEVGVGGSLSATWTWSVHGYRTDIDDLIDLDSATFLPANITEARIRGVELESAATFGATSISLNYSYVDPRNTTPGPNRNNLLQRRAKQTGRLQIGQRIGPVQLGAVLRASGYRYNNSTNTLRLDGYALVDLLGEWRIGDRWQLDWKIANALDKDYETVYLYNEPRLNALVSVQYRFN